MTPREILEGIDRLQARFGRSYHPDQLESVWPQLLDCEAVAFNRAVGSLCKGSRFLPRPDYLLDRTLWMHCDKKPAPHRARKNVDLGLVSMRLFTRRLRDEISDDDYIAELWRLSEEHRAARFALDARKRESERSAAHVG